MNSSTDIWLTSTDYKHDVLLHYHPGRLPMRPWSLRLSKLGDYAISLRCMSLAEIENLGHALLAAVERERNVDRIQAEKQSDK